MQMETWRKFAACQTHFFVYDSETADIGQRPPRLAAASACGAEPDSCHAPLGILLIRERRHEAKKRITGVLALDLDQYVDSIS